MNPTIRLVELKETSSLSPHDQIGNVVLCDHLSASAVLSLCVHNGVKHVIQKSNLESEAELQLSSLMILAPDRFISFPLSTIFGEENPTEETEKNRCGLSISINTPKEKSSALDQVDSYVVQFANPKSIVNDVRTVSDELLTNSIFNAPYVNLDNSASGPTRDISKITIDPEKRPMVFAGRDENRVIIGCRDLYGRLNVVKFVERILKCYMQNPGELLNYGPGGAGIGSFLVFDACTSLYVAVEKGKSTTICCAFPLQMSARKRNGVPKNLHIFYG